MCVEIDGRKGHDREIVHRRPDAVEDGLRHEQLPQLYNKSANDVRSPSHASMGVYLSARNTKQVRRFTHLGAEACEENTEARQDDP